MAIVLGSYILCVMFFFLLNKLFLVYDKILLHVYLIGVSIGRQKVR